jgi:D-3-phosphoglycerate dehydrogenase
MLMLMRNMYTSVAEVKRDNWNWRNHYTGDELAGKTLGILGMGNIGKRVARLAAAFGMNVIYWNRSVQDVSYAFLTMDEVLQQSDVLSLHLPYTKETGTLISEVQLALVKPGAQLINTARGQLIDHEALLAALNSGQLSGFAADVLPEEPPVKGFPIVRHPNVLVTPHSGSLTASTFRKMCVLTVQNVASVLGGNEPDPLSIFNRSALRHSAD